jgi:HPr kinase/phosphorylase
VTTLEPLNLHATSVDLAGAGVLIRGASGSGKSDLALRLIDGGARLVADDRSLLHREGEELVLSAPSTIAGQIEVRGIGIIRVPSVNDSRLRLVIDLMAPASIERLPEPRWCEFLGLERPLLVVDPFTASAAAKVRIAVAALAQGLLWG